MTNPFGSSDAQIFLGGLLGSDDAAVVVKHAITAFDSAYDAADRHSLVPERVSIEFWVCACLIDAVVNGTLYEPDDTTYQKSFKAVQAAFARRKLFHKNPIHDIQKSRKAVFDLLVVFDDEDKTELARRLHGTREYAEFSEAITDLMDRMEPPLKRGREA